MVEEIASTLENVPSSHNERAHSLHEIHPPKIVIANLNSVFFQTALEEPLLSEPERLCWKQDQSLGLQDSFCSSLLPADSVAGKDPWGQLRLNFGTQAHAGRLQAKLLEGALTRQRSSKPLRSSLDKVAKFLLDEKDYDAELDLKNQFHSSLHFMTDKEWLENSSGDLSQSERGAAPPSNASSQYVYVDIALQQKKRREDSWTSNMTSLFEMKPECKVNVNSCFREMHPVLKRLEDFYDSKRSALGPELVEAPDPHVVVRV
jgi:hypothetical protein